MKASLSYMIFMDKCPNFNKERVLLGASGSPGTVKLREGFLTALMPQCNTFWSPAGQHFNARAPKMCTGYNSDI